MTTRAKVYTDTEMINRVLRATPRRSKLFDELTAEGRRRVLDSLGGEDWRTDEVIENVRDEPGMLDLAKCRKGRATR